LLVVAHGENWEVAASQAVTDVIKKFIAENNLGKEQLQENGTFELHYTPTNTVNKSFTIPLTTPDDHQLNNHVADKKHWHLNGKKNDQDQLKVNSNDTVNSRL